MLKITRLRYIIVHKDLVGLDTMYYSERSITFAPNFSQIVRVAKSDEMAPTFMRNSSQQMVSISKFTQWVQITPMLRPENVPPSMVSSSVTKMVRKSATQ